MTTPAAIAPEPNRRAGPGALAVALAAGVLILAWSITLWPEWRTNPDLSHGLFAPLIFVLLMRESRRQGTLRWLPRRSWRTAATVGVLAGACLLAAVAGLLAASVGWTHALVRFVLAAALAGSLLAALLVLAGDEVRAMPLNFASLTAVFLWVLVAPLPHGTYARLTLSLQSSVTSGVLQALHLLGVPARQHGNIIELATTTVGVEEACSGIRSLLSCVYAGFFFAAWLVRSRWGRALLVVAAPLLAIVMNYFRSLTLTLLANAGTDISGFWHDATGFAILGLTAALLAGLAMRLSPSPLPAPAALAPAGNPARAAAVTFWSGHAALAALALFFWSHSRPAGSPGTPAPDLPALLPAAADGWEVYTAKDLYRFSDVLHTDTLFERTYLRRDGNSVIQLTAYVAYWRAGQAPVSLVASHTPDACWPGSGWIKDDVPSGLVDLSLPGRKLAPAEHRLFRQPDGYGQHVWFWHLHDGRVINYRDPYSVPALLQIALQYGFRREGDQLFIRISSNVAWERLAGDPLLRQLLDNLTRTGL